jgi:phenylalanine-4-hydroxylase
MASPIEVPPHLRQYVVSQNYDAYTVEDQAVWRFVLLQTHSRLLRTGHPAYSDGFDGVGISVERIPRIAEMNERLERSAFQAVCVDGFIPPRAFQGFQARGFLPIAADIRTSRQLAYTPAPDIIHEAAGHAPFLAHAEYAHYLRRIGAVGERAFSDIRDREGYEAAYLLSELKANPASTPEQLARAEAQVARCAAASLAAPSEAARLARLYWWTVEYGLVGTVDDYRLYGAGLLSSLGEGHFCHDAQVAKRPLTASCIDVAYDITRPQPQLFVARDFEHLDRVLDEVARTLGQRAGGELALQRALESAEAACIELPHGAQLIGWVRACHGHAPDHDAIELTGPCALAFHSELAPGWPRVDRYVLPLGSLADGTSLSELGADRLKQACTASGWLQLHLRNGIAISGQLLRATERAGRVAAALLGDCAIEQGGRVLLKVSDPYPLVFAERVASAHAALPSGYYPATEFAGAHVPKPRDWSPEQRGILELYEQALAALRERFGSEVVPRFEAIHEELCDRYPEEWLLRWNLLESLIKLHEVGPLAVRLERELEQLEIRFAHREPIATGLAYLKGLGHAPASRPREPGGVS